MQESILNNSSSKSKRIAYNTVLLYARMLVTMAIGLYSSRLVLQVLGVADYGLYNVVGGIVVVFSVLSGSLSAAISRYLTYELGKGDIEKLKRVFCTSVNIQLALALLIMVLAETVGLWFLNAKMVIAPDRMTAANWVYQLSVITFAVNLISVPYNASIISHEKMSAFAYISIFEVVAKLIVVLVTMQLLLDKLIVYAVLICLVSVFMRFVYGIYCKRKFEECTYQFQYDHELTKKMFGFAGWNFLGAASGILMTQGANIISNLFFGVAVNAARGIASQLDGALSQFVNNFTTALNPQITKSYAVGDMDYLNKLVFYGAKYSFFLLMIFAVPFCIEANTVLKLWLGEVPDYSVIFTQSTIMISLFYTLSNTMVTAMLATGNIKKYQIYVGGTGFLVCPIVYALFRLGLPPESAYLVHFLIYVAQWLIRIKMMRDMIGMSVGGYLSVIARHVVPVFIIVLSLSFIPTVFLNSGIIRLISVFIVSVFSSILAIYWIGLSAGERVIISSKLIQLKSKYVNKVNINQSR